MKLRNIIRYTLGAVFLISALLKLLDYNSTAELFVSILGLDATLTKISLGMLIIVELIIAYLFIAGYINYKFIFLSVVSLVTVFIVVNLFFLFKGYSNCGCFGIIVSSSPLLSIIKNIILLLGLYYLKRVKTNMNQNETVKGFEK